MSVDIMSYSQYQIAGYEEPSPNKLSSSISFGIDSSNTVIGKTVNLHLGNIVETIPKAPLIAEY